MFDAIKNLIDYKLRFSSYFHKRLESIKSLEELDENQLIELRNKKFQEILKRALLSKFYKQLYSEYGVSLTSVQNIDDIIKLPVIDKSLVRDKIKDIFLGNSFTKIKAFTSGTSGSPLMVYRDYSSIIEEGAYIWAHRAKSNFHPGMRAISLRGNLDRSKFEKYDSYSNTLFLSSYNINENNYLKYYEKIANFSPYAILAYPSSVELLANLFDQKNLKIHVPYIFTSSETLYDFQKNILHKVFGSKIRDWYGNAERTIALQEDENGYYDEIPLYSINEFERDSTITTALINSSFPLIRYHVNDIIETLESKNSLSQVCKIQKIQGRVDDTLVLKDGTRIGRLDVAFKGISNLLFAQFVQNDINSFRLNIVVNDKFNPSDKNQIRQNVVKRVGEEMNFEIFEVDKEDIILSNRGKYKLVISQIQDEKIEVKSELVS